MKSAVESVSFLYVSVDILKKNILKDPFDFYLHKRLFPHQLSRAMAKPGPLSLNRVNMSIASPKKSSMKSLLTWGAWWCQIYISSCSSIYNLRFQKIPPPQKKETTYGSWEALFCLLMK